MVLTYATSRQIFLQEAISHYLPELWQGKSLENFLVKTNIPSKMIMLCKSEEEIMELHTESTDIFKDNWTECYMDRPKEI